MNSYSQEDNYLLTERRDKLLIVKFNRPEKKNAINKELYDGLAKILRQAARDDNINVLAITGVGEFYSSGNDLSRQTNNVDDLDEFFKEKKIMISNFTTAFLEFPKLLVAVVNGPCFGIAATTAALCDIVYCSNTAYFLTPFTKLGICAEGGSSYTFPLILGKSKAMEMLLCNHKLTAEEALKFNFVSEIFNVNEIDKIWKKLLEYSKLPIGSLKVSKELVQKVNRDKLEKAVLDEIHELEKRWTSDEFFEAIASFFNSKL